MPNGSIKMCGRIVQKSGPEDYVERLFPNMRRIFADSVGPQYNIPPGTRPLTMHRLAGDFDVDRQYWTWKPAQSKYKMNCARLDKILVNAWPWKMLTAHGRILIPVDGWYEWQKLGDESNAPKQPYYIHAESGMPLFFAGVSAWRPGDLNDEAHGFAIITDDALHGMIDVHGRRPVALAPDLAKQWIDPELPVARAVDLLRHCLPETDFRWHTVRLEVGNTAYKLPDAIAPI